MSAKAVVYNEGGGRCEIEVDEYLYVDAMVNGVEVAIQIKLDAEGPIVDMFDPSGECVATMCAEYLDFQKVEQDEGKG